MIRTMLVLLALQSGYAAAQISTPETRIFVSDITTDAGETFVTDEFFRTLYVFDMDLKQKTSTCNGDCAETWPPYVVSAKEAAKLKAPLGTLARANKTLQLTYQGRPVYLFAFDRTVTENLGDGIGGVWHHIKLK